MIEPKIAILVIWILVFIYSIAGSIDFGASFWAMIYTKQDTQASEIANRFLSPTWEINNTILVLLVVAVVGFFPEAAFTFGTVLLVPVSLILLLILLRSSFMVFAYSVQGYNRTLRTVSGLTGVLVPALLISALPVTEGGFVHVGPRGPELDFGIFFTSPSVYMYMLFGLTSELFLSSLFLADYSKESKDQGAYKVYRRNAILFGPITLVVAVVTLLSFRPEASWLLSNISRYQKWFVLSIIMFVIGYSALWWSDRGRKAEGKPRIAVIFVILQYGIATFAYGASHLPYIVYPYLTVGDAFTNINTFYSLLNVLGLGLAILLPGFIVFWALFLKDKRYLQRK
ncbi:cytochrome d ubiquinol oxidase subunit II [Baia soyae]|uniref:Cytochrome bd-I ubiquinol oxidase subunit 2 apoprotein n=1 Tax=Baia soyae TaxID=1544746 RepID=A0A4R2RFR5_9BACL|nr:cytochrome d ubiquinol oxidase subunit II [Baia soyae]TCP62472.1 cytochrome bd-I ubiquinol oxidase subunit 2 apoprotein [Baia soyae]